MARNNNSWRSITQRWYDTFLDLYKELGSATEAIDRVEETQQSVCQR